MNRILERTTVIIIALLLSINFTGQQPSHAQAKLWVKVKIGDDDKLTALETLTKSYVERELRDLGYVNVVDTLETFTVGIIMEEPQTRSGDKQGLVVMSTIFGKWHKDNKCLCLLNHYIQYAGKSELPEMCLILVANLDQVMKKYRL